MENETSSPYENVGEEVASIVEAHTINANVRSEQAEYDAKRIAEAAMENERGHRIEKLETELGECRNQLSEQNQSISAIRETLAEVNGAVAALVMTAPISPIPPEPVAEEVPEAMEVSAPNEDTLGEAIPEERPPETKRKRRSWI